MKVLNIPFEDKEVKLISQIKDSSGLSWHDFILKLSVLYYKHGKLKKEANNGKRK